MDFSETIVIYDLKLATDDRSDKKFLLASNFCPMWAVCLLAQGYKYILFLYLQQMNEVTRHFC